MNGVDSPLIFLAGVFLISLSGVVMPGPVLATTLTRGYEDKMAGFKIALGHAIVEIPLIVAIYYGFESIFKDQLIFAVIGIVGGIFLLYMGVSMFKTKAGGPEEVRSKYGAVPAGIVLTTANPYFFLWWATVGASLVAVAAGYGAIMIPMLAAVHLACDFGWLMFVSYSVNKSKNLWTGKWYRYLYAVCGGIMVFFALYFIVSSATTLL